jgi:GT2 family glycosyltransferase
LGAVTAAVTVAALVVSHDGRRWLPAVLDGIEAQTRPVEVTLAVDTESSDASHDLLVDRLGAECVRSIPGRSTYAAAVREGLAALPGAVEGDWIWLLHDDSAPAPDALQRLLAAATDPDIAVLGPKLLEWPSLRRLLEVGVTITGTGHRETGLERGEYDQGQHDTKRDVLAVNTAGMLVRREVLERIGFDDRLPILGNDIDFGWRVARAGHRSRVVPEAVVFHVEAAHRGARSTPLTGRRPARRERAASLYTLLVGCSLPVLPVQLVRLFLASLLRAVGFLLVRAPKEAYDEVAALLTTYLRPDLVVRGRIARRRTATVPARAVRPLLAPVWLPYRHGADAVADMVSALVNQAGDLTAARRARATAETGPVDEDAENLPADTGLFARVVTSPVSWVFLVLLLLAVAGLRGHLGSGSLSGGALLPAPDGAGDWWHTYFSASHGFGLGSTSPAAPYLLPMALAGSVLFGSASLLVDVLFFGAVPLAAWGAYRLLRGLTGSRAAALWAAVAYGLLPVLTGSVPQGRLGSVVAAAVLPWLVGSARHLVTGATADRRWRACFRTALWLALLTAFAPLAWLMAAVAVVVGLLAGLVTDRRRWAGCSHFGPVLVALVAGFGLVLPWSLATLWHQGLGSWFLEAGRPASHLVGRMGPWDVVVGRPGQVGAAPGWVTAGITVAAVAALLRADTRPRVVAAWSLGLLGLAFTAVLAGARVALASSATPERVWLGLPVLVTQGAAVTAVALAGAGIGDRLSGVAFGWRQPVGLVVAVAAAASAVAGLGWWAANGTGGVVERQAADQVPAYMSDAAERDSNQGILLVRGSQRAGFSYVVLRSSGLRLGDDTVLPPASAQAPVTNVVGHLAATAPSHADVAELGDAGVQFVYARRPADQQLAGNLDSGSGIVPASTVARGSRAWQLQQQANGDQVVQRTDAPRVAAVLLQLLAVVVIAVLALPSRAATRP